MVQENAPITIDEVATLLGAKDIEAFLLRKQIALLNQQVQALTEEPKPEDEKEEKGE